MKQATEIQIQAIRRLSRGALEQTLGKQVILLERRIETVYGICAIT